MRRILCRNALARLSFPDAKSTRLGASVPKKERPTVNVPAALRQSNWIGNQGQGSCVHATMISLLPLAVPAEDGRLLAAELRRRRIPGRPSREVRPRGNPLCLRRQR